MLTGDDRALADAGLDSLTLVTLIFDLEQLLIETTGIAMETTTGRGGRAIDGGFVQACTLTQLRDLVKLCESSPDEVWATIETMGSGVRAAHDESVRARMRSDARLGAWKSAAIQASVDRDVRVLLTGATGFFGPFLLQSLLELTPYSYHVLIRARDRAAGLDKVR